jgi:hypothetical protein
VRHSLKSTLSAFPFDTRREMIATDPLTWHMLILPLARADTRLLSIARLNQPLQANICDLPEQASKRTMVYGSYNRKTSLMPDDIDFKHRNLCVRHALHRYRTSINPCGCSWLLWQSKTSPRVFQPTNRASLSCRRCW